MKRIISFLTVLSLLAATLAMAVMPVAAETNYDDNLVSWYNFSGETQAEQAADKAQKGTADEMTFANITVENGNAVISDAKGSYLSIANGGDFAQWNGKTFYIAYRANGDATGGSGNVVCANGLFRYWIGKGSTVTNYKHGGGLGANAATTTKFTINSETPVAPAAGSDWFYTVVTFTYAEGIATANIYNSADGSTYVLSSNTYSTDDVGSGVLASNRTVLIGKPGTGSAGNVGFTIGEIRFYDTVIPAEAIATLASHTPYGGEVTPEPDPEPELPEINPVKGLFDANLVTYYNFEGATAEEQFADKAPNGLTNDVLDVSPNVTVSNGAANIPSAKGEYLAIDALEGDTAELTGKTIYIAYTTSGNAVQYATDLISANKIFRYWLAKNTTDSNYLMGGGIGSAPTKEGKLLNLGTAPKAPLGEWYYTAITIDMSDDQLVITCYNSADGVNYVASETVYTDSAKPENLLRNVSLVIGKNTKTIDDRGLSFKIDEFRMYDKVMTADEVSLLTAATPSAEAVRVLGWQEKTNASNLLDVRFLAHLNVTEADLSRYTAVGFEISANYKGVDKETKTVRCTTVYNSITADGQAITVATYDQVDGYIIALPVYNVPVDDTVTFTVRPFYEMNGETVYGETAIAVYTNGVAAE
ncbi:MAG: LamG domain-containing protein [Ruminococcaceae bacterium]|nr:LamG domain-containing protein [Oscillospiraceae bacterium]